MPLYDFVCNKCKEEIEESLSLEDYNNKGLFPRCPKCGKAMKRCISQLKAKHGSWAEWRRWQTMQDK